MAYDPARISYEQLLDVFWSSHDPTLDASSPVRSVIMVHDEAQRRAAERALAAQPPNVYTTIEPMGAFHLAEQELQKFYLRTKTDLEAEFTEAEILNATAATKINAYAYGDLEKSAMRKIANDLGLSWLGRWELMRVK